MPPAGMRISCDGPADDVASGDAGEAGLETEEEPMCITSRTRVRMLFCTSTARSSGGGGQSVLGL